MGNYLGVTALAALGATEWLVLCKPVLRLLNTPQDMMEMAHTYLRTLYGGVCISFCYNMLAAFLRAAGDSRTPLVAVSLAAVCNIILDLLFVVVLHLGGLGAALATLLSQLFSAGYCLWAIGRGGFVRLGREDFRIRPERLGQLLYLGLPMGLQNVITGLGGVAVQSVINGFGTIFVAGFTAANKLYGLLETAAVSYSYAAVSFVMLTLARLILSCFLSGEESVLAQTLEIGFAFLKILSAFFWLLYLLYIVRACVQGMGNTLLPMCSSFFTACHAGGLRFFPDEENRSDGRVLGRNLRLAFGGCVFVFLSVVGVQSAVQDAKKNIREGTERGLFPDLEKFWDKDCQKEESVDKMVTV